MATFGLFHVYLIFFLVGLGYTTVAILMGQLGGGEHGGADHEMAADADVDGFAAHDIDTAAHDVDIGAHDVDIGGHDADVGDHDAGGHDFDQGEVGHDQAGVEAGAGEAMPSISPLSPVTIATFATSFGGIGLILEEVGAPGALSIPLAGASGFVVAGAVFYVFYLVFRVTQSTSAVSPRQVLGKPAEVITAIPKDGVGEIAYVLGGRRFNAPARSEDGHPIPRHASVVVLRATPSACYVRESAVEQLKDL